MRSLIKAIFKTGAGTVVSLLLNIITTKVVALLLGPSGLGLYSLLRQATLTLSAFGLGGQTALVHGVASTEGQSRDIYTRTVFSIFLIGTAVTASLIILFSEFITEQVFGEYSEENNFVIQLLVIPVLAINMRAFFNALLNGNKAIGKLAIVEVLGPAVSFLIVYPVCLYIDHNYAYAMIALIMSSQIVMMISSLSFCTRAKFNEWMGAFRLYKLDKHSTKKYLHFAGVTTLTALTGAGAIFIVKASITSGLGIDYTGIFDVSWTLSSSYIIILLGSFSTYYLPELSSQDNFSGIQVVIKQVFRLSVALILPVIVAAICLKPLIIEILYSEQFLEASQTLRWMLIGDFFKVSAWVFTYPILALSAMRTFLALEVLWSFLFALISYWVVHKFQSIEYIGTVFMGLYILTTILYYWVVYRIVGGSLKLKDLVSWAIAFLVILFVSVVTWNDTTVDVLRTGIFLVIAIVISLLFLKEEILAWRSR